MSKKLKFPNDTVIELLQEASLIQALGQTAVQTTKFEGEFTSENILQNIFDLKTSMTEVLTDLQNLKELYSEIDRKKSEMEKNIKLSERVYLAFQKEQISTLDSIKKEYETKLAQTQAETKKTEEKAKLEAKQEIDRKERERNKLITETEREVTRAINEAERTKNNKVKQLTSDLEKFRKDTLKEKQDKITQYNSAFDQFMKDLNDLKSQLTKKEDELIKVTEKVKAGKNELKELERQLKIDIKGLKESIALVEEKVDSKKSELEQNIKSSSEQFDSLISEREKYSSKEIANSENEFNEFKEKEIEKLEKVKTKEEDNFAKLKENRATSVAELRAQQKAIMKAFEEKKEDTVTVAEKDAKKAIEDKRIEIDKQINGYKDDFETFRKTKMATINQKLSNSVETLTQKMTLIS